MTVDSWKVMSFEGTDLHFKLNISNPIDISQATRNQLIVQFIKPALFETKEDGYPLADKSTILKGI